MDLRELHREIILDHSRRPRHRGACAGETHGAAAENPACGDEVALHLRVDAARRIEEATFTGQGCALSQASASLLAARLRGRTVAEAMATAAQVRRLLAGEDLTAEERDALGDLGALGGAAEYPQRAKCASLAWQALQNALGGAANEPST